MRHLSLLATTALSAVVSSAAMAADLTALHTFSQSSGAGYPVGALVPSNGLLYGTTYDGTNEVSGVIFSVDPATGAERNLYVFNNGANALDGFAPTSGLTALNGKFYGVTSQGNGTQATNSFYKGYGTVFAFDPATNVETPLHNFNGADGAQPSLTYDPLVTYNNALYGTAFYGGPNGRGAIYSITPSGAFSLVYGFPSADNGCNPTGITIVNGTLYGTTQACGTNGGGNLYALNLATGTQTILHSFDSNSFPTGQPIVDGNVLYGITELGGSDQAGTVYKIDLTSGAYTLVHNFTVTGSDGGYPTAGLTLQNGVIYGTDTYGPGDNYTGVVFKIDPSTSVLTALADFTFDVTGYAPGGPLLPYNGAFYGTTVNTGEANSNEEGTVYKFTP